MTYDFNPIGAKRDIEYRLDIERFKVNLKALGCTDEQIEELWAEAKEISYTTVYSIQTTTKWVYDREYMRLSRGE